MGKMPGVAFIEKMETNGLFETLLHMEEEFAALVAERTAITQRITNLTGEIRQIKNEYTIASLKNEDLKSATAREEWVKHQLLGDEAANHCQRTLDVKRQLLAEVDGKIEVQKIAIRSRQIRLSEIGSEVSLVAAALRANNQAKVLAIQANAMAGSVID